MLSAFLILCTIIRLLQHGATCDVLHCGASAGCEYHGCHNAFCFTRGRAPSAAPQKTEKEEREEFEEREESRHNTMFENSGSSSWLRTSHHSEIGDSNRRSQVSEADAFFDKPLGTMTHPTLSIVSLAPRTFAGV